VGGGAASWVTVTATPAMVSVAVRGAVSVLAAAMNATVPEPVPDAPAVMVSQAALLDPVQVHVDADAVTLTCPDAPAAATVCVAGATVNVQAGGVGGGGAPVCVTGIVRPATVMEPVRAAVSVLAAMVTRRSPLPVPPSELVVTQAAPGAAVHAQVDAVAVTETMTVAAALSWVIAGGVTVKLHDGGGSGGGSGVGGVGVGGVGVGGVGVGGVGGCGGGVAPTWVTVSVRPATVSVPMRGDVEVLGLVTNRSSAVPVPGVPPVTVTQSTRLAPVHGQAAGA
jgi:hypothetical protein